MSSWTWPCTAHAHSKIAHVVPETHFFTMQWVSAGCMHNDRSADARRYFILDLVMGVALHGPFINEHCTDAV